VYIDLVAHEPGAVTSYIIEFHWHTCALDLG
jgi:hypothetical protein